MTGEPVGLSEGEFDLTGENVGESNQDFSTHPSDHAG